MIWRGAKYHPSFLFKKIAYKWKKGGGSDRYFFISILLSSSLFASIFI